MPSRDPEKHREIDWNVGSACDGRSLESKDCRCVRTDDLYNGDHCECWIDNEARLEGHTKS